MIPDIGIIIGVYVILRLVQMGSRSDLIKCQNGNYVHNPGVVMPMLYIVGIIAVVVCLVDMLATSSTSNVTLP